MTEEAPLALVCRGLAGLATPPLWGGGRPTAAPHQRPLSLERVGPVRTAANVHKHTCTVEQDKRDRWNFPKINPFRFRYAKQEENVVHLFQKNIFLFTLILFTKIFWTISPGGHFR